MATSFRLRPYNEYDSFYESLIRKNLGTFHINLSHGLYSSNGPLVSPSISWNVNGLLLISRASFVARLTGFNASFHGLEVPDIYHIVDGHVGAVMYRLQGPQTGPFENIPPSGEGIDVLGGELMTFNKDALLWDLKTVEEISIAESQLLGKTAAGPLVTNLTSLLVENPQTSPEFRQHSREAIASIHENFNSGNNAATSHLLSPNINVILGSSSNNTSPQAFVEMIAKWSKTFPDMVYHDDAVLADGKLGASEWVWEGTQTGSYTAMNGTVLEPSGKSVRMRGFLFFEFTQDGLINKVTGVWDEGVIEEQLNGGPAYP